MQFMIIKYKNPNSLLVTKGENKVFLNVCNIILIVLLYMCKTKVLSENNTHCT